MNNTMAQRVLWIMAAILLLAAAGLTARSLLVTPDRMDRIRKKQDDIRKLMGMYREVGDDDAAVSVFEALPNRQVVPLTDVLKKAAPGLAAEIRQREPQAAKAGWALRRVDVVFNDVSLEQVAQFIYNAETQRPRWRLTECHITAADTAGMAGRVTLAMEALERK